MLFQITEICIIQYLDYQKIYMICLPICSEMQHGMTGVGSYMMASGFLI